MSKKLILLELNEVNFDYIKLYCDRGRLPAFRSLIYNYGIIETRSEKSYSELEPWIQWVTAHTGQSFAEHGIFRLGDIVQREVFQIWEAIESSGRKVGAVSPMNAVNRCSNPAFFVPDPWTDGQITGPMLVRKLYHAIAQAVNDNAQAKLSLKSAFWLSVGLARYAAPKNYHCYLRLLTKTLRGQSWSKALLLDLLLADVFKSLLGSNDPDFSSLFLNAGAHIQHHYMFNSQVYDGFIKNPEWYINSEFDPVLDVYEIYDRIIADLLRAHSDKRIMIATGLHQDAHDELTYYWRLRDHAAFLRQHDIVFSSVQPRMSRDFLVRFASAADAAMAEARLNSMVSQQGIRLFEVDNRGNELFVMLVWSHDIDEQFVYLINGIPQYGLRDSVAFVAIKNGHHNGIGYLIDTGRCAGITEPMPLFNLPKLICDAFDLDWETLRV